MIIRQLSSILIVTTLVLASCGGGAPAATQAPAATEAPTTAATQAPTEAPTQAATEAPTTQGCPEEFPPMNDSKAVSLALPEPSAVVLRVVPLAQPTTDNVNALQSAECGVIIGELIAERDLPMPDPNISPLHPDKYLVMVKKGLMSFIDGTGNELSTSIAADVRTIETRSVSTPEAFITVKDICYSWSKIQVCTPPIPNMALTDDELKNIQEQMNTAVEELKKQGLLDQGDINIAGTISDMAGNTANNKQQASLLAAPTVKFLSKEGTEKPDNDQLLGVVIAILPVDFNGNTILNEGTYAVFAVNNGADEWQGRFVAPDKSETLVPAKYLEVRGEINKDGPLAIVIDLRICLCFFEC